MPTTADIRVYTADATAETAGSSYTKWEERQPSELKATIEGNTVSVTGFDYNANFVSDKAKPNTTDDFGRKLIIEFTVQRAPGFIGGNQVPTNEDTSGVYAKDSQEPVDSFDVPRVDVPLIYEYNTQDQTIFVGEQADLAGRITLSEKHPCDGINNAFVDIVFTVKQQGSDEVIGTYTIPAGGMQGTWDWTTPEAANPYLQETTDYDVTCTVTPTTVGKYNPMTLETPDFTVFVKSGTLTIHKNVGNPDDPDEKYIFHVQKDGKEYMTVTVAGNGSTTITNLPRGTYTVVEDTSWSWRYDSEITPASVTINEGNLSGEITCTNTLKDEHWLNDYDSVKNVGGQKSEQVEGGAQ